MYIYIYPPSSTTYNFSPLLIALSPVAIQAHIPASILTLIELKGFSTFSMNILFTIIFVFHYLSKMRESTGRLSCLAGRAEAERSMWTSSLAIKLDVMRECIVAVVIIVSHCQT